MRDKRPITVVIATLGGESLASTLVALNCGSFVPAEILICIPAEDAHKVEQFRSETVKILKTDCRGQVAQRLVGFRHVSTELVMQLDDDMLVDGRCLELLEDSMQQLGSCVAIAPALVDQNTGTSIYVKPKRNPILLAIYYWLMNGSAGYEPGCTDKSGSAVGIDPSTPGPALRDVEWLAGGCILHYKKNLVLENFWPRPGKAYCEDVLHSHLLRSKGIRLKIDTAARCSLELFREPSLSLKEFVTNLYRDYGGRQYYMQRLSRRSPRIYLYYVARILNYLHSRFTSK
ncbi:MAG: hypothetical protein V4614_08970 [Pseudomonadota bacterium]